MEKFADYLAAIQDVEQRERLREVLNWVIQKFPNLESKIAWNQPMFTDHGTFIIGFSVSRQHFAVSPEVKGIEKFSDEIVESGYSHGKNIFRIKWDDPVDYTLLERMIQFNIDDKKECTAFWRK
ncbi:iron chaperone [uncultured Robinsoniella sp.]|uniref:iron chaperone n=1 Tax=uncultured Robinsoniella sp. TaxID=904190 RepID=UPI00374F7F6B